MVSKSKKGAVESSLPLILVGLFFPPIAIGLIFLKLSSIKDIFDKDKLLQAEKRFAKYMNTRMNGYSFLLYSFILTMYALFVFKNIKYLGNYFQLFGIILIFLAIYLIYKGVIDLPKHKRFPNYFTCIADSKNGSVDAISIALGYPYETVVSDIEFLINKGILEKTFINHSKRIIVSPIIGETILKNSHSIVCPNCGATNEIIGETAECEFCGTILK